VRTYSDVVAQVSLSGQLHVPAALSPVNETPVLIWEEAGWDPEQVWTFWRTERSVSLLGIKPRSSDQVLCNPNTIQMVSGSMSVLANAKIQTRRTWYLRIGVEQVPIALPRVTWGERLEVTCPEERCPYKGLIAFTSESYWAGWRGGGMSDIDVMAPSAARRGMDWSSSAGRRMQDSYGGHITSAVVCCHLEMLRYRLRETNRKVRLALEC
jgi:hypothetical protein